MVSMEEFIGQLMKASGEKLDQMASGMMRTLVREYGESDDAFRKRLIAWIGK